MGCAVDCNGGMGSCSPESGWRWIALAIPFFTRSFAGQPGIDPYTTAVSDLYQDLFGEGIFTGKGIYDLKTVDRMLWDRFPDNAILQPRSHRGGDGPHCPGE